MPTTDQADNTIRIFQTHDSAGNPALGEFVHVVQHKSLNTLASDAMEFLAPLRPEQTGEPGVFRYRDPARGSGTLRIEGFGNITSARIQELVRMEEINRAVGKEPLKNQDIGIGNAIALRSNNPWFIIGFGVVLIVVGIVSFATAPSTDNPTALVIMAVVLGLVGLALIVTGGIRAPWWMKARRYARENGGTLPSDIKGL